MSDNPRLIEKAFLLREVSLDSVHEKNVRHGHISTLHIWPARRPLAACRAALITTLLDDPGSSEKREEILRRMAGRKIVDAEDKETTEGGILHWKRETENIDDLRKPYDLMLKASQIEHAEGQAVGANAEGNELWWR